MFYVLLFYENIYREYAPILILLVFNDISIGFKITDALNSTLCYILYLIECIINSIV